MHFCADEALLIMSSLPFLGWFFQSNWKKIHGWFHKDKCPHDGENKNGEK